MIGLIIKDVLNLRKHTKAYLIILIFYFAIGIANEDFSMVSSMIALIAAMMPITAMSYDERSKWDRYALTMPLSRGSIVVSKYLLGLIFLITAFIITMLFNLLFSKIQLTENILTNLITFSAGIIIMSVIFPILFKFGIEKGRILMMLVLFAPTGIILLLTKFGFEIPIADEETIKPLLYFLPVIATALYVISYSISLFIYKKKEF